MKHFYITFNILLILLTGTTFAQEHRTMETKVADILAQYPTKSGEQTAILSQKIIDLGAEGIAQFTDMLVPLGQGDDTQVRYALESLAQYCVAPGRGTEKNLVEESLLGALKKSSDTEVQTFLLGRLNYCASNASVQAVGSLLSNPKLSSPAIGVLTNIGSAEAGAILLDNVQNKNAQQEIVKALGILKYGNAIPVLTELANSEAVAVRKEALFALAKIADPSSKSTLLAAVEKAEFGMTPNDAAMSYIEYARNLGASGNKSLCKQVCGDIIKNATSGDQLHIRSAAFSILRQYFGNEITKALQKEAKNTTDKKHRKAIFNEASKGMTSSEVSTWLKVFKKLKNDGKIQLLNSLAHRKEGEVLTKAILPALESGGEALRMEAIKVLAVHQKENAVPLLINRLGTTVSGAELETIYNALLRTMDSKSTDLLVEKYSGLPIASQKVALQLLGDKRATQHFDFVSKQTSNTDPGLQMAAYQNIANVSSVSNTQQLIALLKQTDNAEAIAKVQAALSELVVNSDEGESQIIGAFQSGGDKSKLLPIFPALGSKEAFAIVTEGLKSSDAETKNAATKALLLWENEDALPYLFDIVSNGGENAEQAFAVYISKVSSIAAIPADQKLLLLRKLEPFAKSDERINQMLRAAGSIKTFLSLVFVSGYMDKEEFSQTAMRSAISIILPRPGEKSKFSGTFVRNAVEKIIQNLKGGDSQYIKIDLNEFLGKMSNEIGYVSIFNGQDLSGWEGLVENPIQRGKMSGRALARAQEKANAQMVKDWFVKDGIIGFKGEGYNNICTIKDYGDFEMLVDWKITHGGDSGIYLRGTPQVQIWDVARTDVGAQVGSGGLYNNKENKSIPLVVADNPVNEWNTFRIKMIGNRVTVHLNGVLVTDNVVLENYWDRKLPIFSKEAIELQAHGENLGFRNIYVREIHSGDSGLTKEEKEEGFVSLFNGKDLDYWVGNKTDYLVKDNIIAVRPTKDGFGNLYTANEYSDFVFRFEFQLTPGANNGLGIHAPLEGDAAYVGKELQILDNTAPIYKNLKPYQYHGSVYGIIPAKRGHLKPVGEWNSQEVIVQGDDIKITLNGVVILEGNMKEASKNGTADRKDHPGLQRNKGHIGFLGHGSELQFRNVRIKDLTK